MSKQGSQPWTKYLPHITHGGAMSLSTLAGPFDIPSGMVVDPKTNGWARRIDLIRGWQLFNTTATLTPIPALKALFSKPTQVTIKGSLQIPKKGGLAFQFSMAISGGFGIKAARPQCRCPSASCTAPSPLQLPLYCLC